MTTLADDLCWSRLEAMRLDAGGNAAGAAALRRIAKAAEGGAWRTIDSAPRDGTAVWLLTDGVPFIGYCDAANWLHKVDRWMIKSGVRRRSADDQQRGIPDDIYGTYGFAEPTHWMSLPKAPAPRPAPPAQEPTDDR